MEIQRERDRPARPPPPLTVEDIPGKIRRLHDESYLYIEQGLSCDEDGQTEQAVTLYKKGLGIIDKGLKIASDVGNMVGSHWDKTKKLVSKMKKTKSQIDERVKNLIETDPAVRRSLSDPPPSYDMSLQENLMDDDVASSNPHTANASEIFKIPNGVQMFFITPEGNVSAPSYPSALGIYKFTDNVASERPPAFLQIGNWTYPLMPGHSPALQSIWGAYVFPDVESQGSSIGVIIPDSVPRDEKSKLENLFKELTQFRTQESTNIEMIDEDFTFPEIPTEEPTDQSVGNQRVPTTVAGSERTSDKVAKGIVTAAEWISWGLGKGAEKAGVLMKKGSDLIQEKVKPEDKPAEVDPRAQQGIYYARQATGAAVKVSGYIVTKLGEGTMALARMAAPHVRAQGEKLLPKSLVSKDSGGHSKVDDVTAVAVGGLQGWATVYTGLEAAAKALALSLTQETVQVVKHKYGKEAGQITENGMFAAGNVGVAAYNFNNLGVKAVAKRAAKDTGKAVIEDYHNKKSKANVDAMDTCEVGESNQGVRFSRNERRDNKVGPPSKKPDFTGS